MNQDVLLGITVPALALLLGTWGASLVVRALASRASRFSPRWRRRVPRPLHIKPPDLSRLQFWFGMLAGPPFCAAGTALALYVAGVMLTLRDDVNPLYVSGAIVLLMLGLGTLVVGYRWDPADGRRRCPKCWYEYTGLDDSAACPECGHVPRNARALARTRRSPTLLRFGAAIVLSAWLAYHAPRAIETDGRSLIPSTILIGGFERLPERVVLVSGWSGDGSLQARVWNDQLTVGQRAWLYRRSARLLETSDDPRACGLAATFLSETVNVGRRAIHVVPKDDLDAANANLVRVMLRDSNGHFAAAGFERIGMVSSGPLTARVVEEHIDQILARYQASGTAASRIAHGKLIGHLAPLTPELVQAATKTALDPNLAYQDHATACVVLGMLARRDPAHAANLERDFAMAKGFHREALATAIFASKQAPSRVSGGAFWRNVTTDMNDALLEALASDDAAVRNGAIANISVGPAIYGVGYDSKTITSAVRHIAREFSESRVRALQHLTMFGGPTQEDLPELIAIARDGSKEDLIVLAGAVAQVWMGVAWIPLYDAINERMRDKSLDQATLDVLDQIRSSMKRSIPSLR